MKMYHTPESAIQEIKIEDQFLASKPWYDKTGEDWGGDVGFDIEDDETWG